MKTALLLLCLWAIFIAKIRAEGDDEGEEDEEEGEEDPDFDWAGFKLIQFEPFFRPPPLCGYARLELGRSFFKHDRFCRVFISVHDHDALDFARKLGKRLEETWTHDVFVCAVPLDGKRNDIETVVDQIDRADIFIVLGTKNYGREIGNLISTRQQLIYAIEERKPIFVVKMCAKFEESITRFLLPSSFASYLLPDFKPEDDVPDSLVSEINKAVSYQ